MRILFISPTSRAGTPQYTHNLTNALADRGHDIALATGLQFELAEYPRRYTLFEVFDRFRIHPRKLWRFFRFLRSFRPEIIHFQGAQHPGTYLIAWTLLAAVTRARFVYTPQDILPFTPRKHHVVTLRIFYSRMSHVFFTAKQNLQAAVDMFRVDSKKITVLPMGDLMAFKADDDAESVDTVPDDRKLALFFGLIQVRKGVDILIDAFAGVVANVPDAHLSIVGAPHMDVSPYVAEIERLGIGQHVEFRPEYVSLSVMAGYLKRASVIVLPYKSGWNSGVLASAFGFGKPVIATRVGGFDEVVTDEVNGLLVRPDDSTALADALRRVLTDDALYARLCSGARETAELHSWDNIAQVTEQRYREILSEN